MAGTHCIHSLVAENDESAYALALLGQLLSIGVNIDVQDRNGNTPLHLAAISISGLKMMF